MADKSLRGKTRNTRTQFTFSVYTTLLTLMHIDYCTTYVTHTCGRSIVVKVAGGWPTKCKNELSHTVIARTMVLKVTVNLQNTGSDQSHGSTICHTWFFLHWIIKLIFELDELVRIWTLPHIQFCCKSRSQRRRENHENHRILSTS
jgi:hypothetical protein